MAILIILIKNYSKNYTINPNNGYRTPINYFQEVEDQILNGWLPRAKTPSFWLFWKAWLWPVRSVFFVIEKNAVDQTELQIFLLKITFP